jgi:membrane protein DedA with SNARE-associated domain
VDDLIPTAMAFITEHRGWAGPIIGVLTFGESLAVIGLLMPATALMIATGSMIGTGLLDPLPVFLWAATGAILGDWVSFAIGRAIGHSAYYRWPLNRHREGVAKTRLFFRRYGLVSILFGRFLGPVRATIPLVAGVMGMKQRTFQIANVASAILWVPALLAPGFLAARSMGPVEQITEMHIFAIGAFVAAMTFGGLFLGARLLGGTRRRRRRDGLASR